MAVAAARGMTRTPQPKPLTDAELARVGGGFDIGGLIGSIGGIADKFTGGKASQITGMIQKFLPSGGG